jgi:hypothetical protein
MANKEYCYDCGIEITKNNRTVEHVPAKNLYEGFSEKFKMNRITVPACRECNQKYSKIDQEIRDALAVKNADPAKMAELTGKGVRSIFRRKNWKDRLHVDVNGHVEAVEFSYDELKQLHIKNFKALFYRKYGFPLPKDFMIEIIADGDDNMAPAAAVLYDYATIQTQWEVSGSEEVFKFILKDITIDRGKDVIYESKQFEKCEAVVGILVYHDSIAAVVSAGRQEFIESCKPNHLH